MFKTFNLSGGKDKVKAMAKIPATISQQLDHNAEIMEKYGFYATPAIVWKMLCA